MPIFEVEHDGQIYEVDAPDATAAAKAFAPARPTHGGPLGADSEATRLQAMQDAFAQGAGAPEAAAPLSPADLRAGAAGATRLATKPGALVTAGAQALGVPGANVKEYNQGAQQLEKDIAGPGNPQTQETGKFAGELLGGSLVPASALKGVTTLGRAVLQGIGGGAVVGGALGPSGKEETPGEVGKNAAVGTAAGGVLGGTIAGAAAIAPTVRNFIVRAADAAKPVAEAARNIAEKAKSALFNNIVPTLGQKTGSPTLLALEAKVAGKRAFDFYNSQIEKFGTAVDAMAAAAGASKDPLAAALKMKETFGRSVAGLQSAASNEYGAGLDAVRSIASKDPNRFRVPMDNLDAALQGLRADVGKPGPSSEWYKWLAPETLKADPKLREAVNYIRQVRAMDPEAGISVDEVIRLKQSANYLRRALKSGRDLTGSQAEQNRIGRTIASGIEKDIDKFLEQGKNMPAIPGQSDPTRDALNLLGQVNDRYKERLAQLADKKSSFVAQVFGRETPKDPAAQWEAFMRLDPGQQIRGINLMREAAPDILDTLKSWKLSDAANKMRDLARAGNISAISPKNFVNEITNGNEIVGKQMWTPRELQDLKSGVAAARTLLTGGASPGSNIGAPAIERAAAAAASRSTPFVVMQFYNFVTRGHVERMLFSEKGIRALQQVAETYKKPTATTIKNLAILQDLALNQSADQGE